MDDAAQRAARTRPTPTPVATARDSAHAPPVYAAVPRIGAHIDDKGRDSHARCSRRPFCAHANPTKDSAHLSTENSQVPTLRAPPPPAVAMALPMRRSRAFSVRWRGRWPHPLPRSACRFDATTLVPSQRVEGAGIPPPSSCLPPTRRSPCWPVRSRYAPPIRPRRPAPRLDSAVYSPPAARPRAQNGDIFVWDASTRSRIMLARYVVRSRPRRRFRRAYRARWSLLTDAPSCAGPRGGGGRHRERRHGPRRLCLPQPHELVPPQGHSQHRRSAR